MADTVANRLSDAPPRDPQPTAVRPTSQASESGGSLADRIFGAIDRGVQTASAFAAALPAPWTDAITQRIATGTPASRNPAIQQPNAAISGLVGVGRTSIDLRTVALLGVLGFAAYRVLPRLLR